MKDLFEKVPEFLAAFNNVVANGFFEDLEVKASCFLGKPHYCLIRGMGCLPNDPKYADRGVGVLVDPNAIIAEIRKMVAEKEPKTCVVEIKTHDWPLYDDDGGGENIVGSKGITTKFLINIGF